MAAGDDLFTLDDARADERFLEVSRGVARRFTVERKEPSLGAEEQFARSTPGVTAPLVGMSKSDLVLENLATAKAEPMTPENYRKLFQ